jgi:succinoglycan biosynthesis protein ExoW
MADSVAVVIPFYQKKAGILTKAITSALAQKNIGACTIIVVDDASPVSARSELADIMRDHPGRIVIIEQANAGPAAARNKGLDSVPAGTEYVAYLDSDDEWIDSHLANALTALGTGYDFYFADHYQLNATMTAFNRAGRIKVSEHIQINDAEHLRAFTGDMFNQILMGNIIGTSTVVYRYAKFPAQRFREQFVYAGEDYLFWLELSTKTKQIAFSSLCECTYGEGVNIFAGSGWGTEKSLIRLHYEIKFKKSLPILFKLNADQLAANKRAVKGLRRSFVADLLHRLLHRKPIETTTLRQHARLDPQTFLFFLPLAVAIKLRR